MLKTSSRVPLICSENFQKNIFQILIKIDGIHSFELFFEIIPGNDVDFFVKFYDLNYMNINSI